MPIGPVEISRALMLNLPRPKRGVLGPIEINGSLYVVGNSDTYNDLYIFRSTDWGATWNAVAGPFDLGRIKTPNNISIVQQGSLIHIAYAGYDTPTGHHIMRFMRFNAASSSIDTLGSQTIDLGLEGNVSETPRNFFISQRTDGTLIVVYTPNDVETILFRTWDYNSLGSTTDITPAGMTGLDPEVFTIANGANNEIHIICGAFFGATAYYRRINVDYSVSEAEIFTTASPFGAQALLGRPVWWASKNLLAIPYAEYSGGTYRVSVLLGDINGFTSYVVSSQRPQISTTYMFITSTVSREDQLIIAWETYAADENTDNALYYAASSDGQSWGTETLIIVTNSLPGTFRYAHNIGITHQANGELGVIFEFYSCISTFYVSVSLASSVISLYTSVSDIMLFEDGFSPDSISNPPVVVPPSDCLQYANFEVPTYAVGEAGVVPEEWIESIQSQDDEKDCSSPFWTVR